MINKRKKVLILGGAGFIGKNLALHLEKQGYDVFCFDHNTCEYGQKITFIKGDFFHLEEVNSAIKGMDCVVHAISTVNPGNSNDKYMLGYQNDFLQTVKLCDVLLKERIKMVFISSGGTVYGDHPEGQPLVEDSYTEPINHYGNVKLCIENAMRSFDHQMEGHFLIARVSNPYGRGQNFHKGVGFIDAVLKNTIHNLPVEIWGDGENIRDYVYIDDVCGMIETIINYEGNINTFNVCSGVGTSQNQIIKIVQNLGYTPQVIYKEKRKVDVRSIILDNHRIMKIWKHNPIDIEEGIKKYSEYLQGLQTNAMEREIKGHERHGCNK